MKALGMIELYGYLAAVEALDSALKAANVSSLGATKVGGGLSEDGSQYFVYEGDELPVVGNEYIFFAYAQPDGSLLISGPVSNMSVSDNTSDIAPFSDSTEYSDIVDAYNNQVDSGRTRFTSSYEAK